MKKFIRSAFLISSLVGMLFMPMLSACAPKGETLSEQTEVNQSPDFMMPSEQQAAVFARSLEEHLKNGNPDFFFRAIDWSTLTDQVLQGIPQAKDAERFDRRYLISLFSEKGGIAQSVAEKVRMGGTYHFLRTKKINPNTIAVTFRLVDADGGLDYHDLYLVLKAGKLVQIREFYLYHFDETFSETLRRTLVPNLYVDGKNDYGMMMSELIMLLHKENKLLIQEFAKAFEEKKPQRALDLFDQLPKELRCLKTFQLWRLKAAQLHDDPAVYSFVLADIRQRYRQEGWIDFLSLDYFFNHREFQKALACINHIDTLVGGDPYLENFRCWAFLNLENIPEAQRHFDCAIAKEPELMNDRSFQSLKKRLEMAKAAPIEPAEQELNPFRKPIGLETIE
ncbi:MAG: hypothetical protein IJF17_10715 [Thermoguttaceae bacterium]|nr:hypothetical protein [Thermoguttaceae bacterium]